MSYSELAVQKMRFGTLAAAGIHRRTEWFKDELGNPSRQVGDIGNERPVAVQHRAPHRISPRPQNAGQGKK
jgi:hypothetical protein